MNVDVETREKPRIGLTLIFHSLKVLSYKQLKKKEKRKKRGKKRKKKKERKKLATRKNDKDGPISDETRSSRRIGTFIIFSILSSGILRRLSKPRPGWQRRVKNKCR
ncbi:hypothetical protein PUN28_019883 [Cardiocondyla obscurior]|uniref:Uncharacterized protein n=1 Tax=Cardiocondyla obscurior TaxID=286306 RepID=A0AAW2EBN7_9HYME